MSIKSSFKKGLYTSLIVAASIIPTKNLTAQDTLFPKGNINMFQSTDATTAAKEYNHLTTREERDNIIEIRVKEDFTKDIKPRSPPTYPYTWNCNQATLQLIVNSHDWGKDTYLDDQAWYNGYDGSDLEQIYQNVGTLKDMGKLGIPTYMLTLNDGVTIPEGHAMNAIITGDTITNWKSWNIIEPQLGKTNVKPGELLFPKTCQSVQIYNSYQFKNDKHEKNYGAIKILEFEIIDGVAKLAYNVNEDKTLVYNADNLDKDPRMFIPLNERVHLITTRKELQDINTGIFNKPTLEQITKIYPNPATNYINIELPGQNNNKEKITIYNNIGQILNEQNIENNEQINVSNLKEGIYLVRITTGNTIYNGKFVKR